jgi:hypothetical protein
MGWKINMSLSIGALFPFFAILLVAFFIELRNLLLLTPVVFLFLISLFVNLYVLKLVQDKEEEFTPKPIKIESVNKMKNGDAWLSLVSIFISSVPIVLSLSSASQVEMLATILILSLMLILIFTFYEKEYILSQILFIRIFFKDFYVAKTDTKSTIYLLSKEKIQANRKIKAYHVINDIYLFGYLTNN